jgi:PTH1 family peptidyl-tRNA hydrolase
MKVIAGLGNPGEKYTRSRHNVGFILLDEIAKENEWSKSKNANAYYSKENIGEEVVEYVKPQTFMNHSGASLKYAVTKQGVNPKDILVIYDDVDLPFGKIKISHKGGDGGHNGIKSITSNIGNEFTKVRIGIAPVDEEGNARKPKGGFFTPASRAVARYVLKDFSKNDLEKVKEMSPRIKNIIETFVKEGSQSAMNKFN